MSHFCCNFAASLNFLFSYSLAHTLYFDLLVSSCWCLALLLFSLVIYVFFVVYACQYAYFGGDINFIFGVFILLRLVFFALSSFCSFIVWYANDDIHDIIPIYNFSLSISWFQTNDKIFYQTNKSMAYFLLNYTEIQMENRLTYIQCYIWKL